MNADLRRYIERLDSPDESEVLEALAALDSEGIFIKPSESLRGMRARALKLLEETDAIRAGDSRFKEICAGAAKISPETISDAKKITRQLYQFSAGWMPVWESPKHTGKFSEGISYEIEGFLPMVFLKSSSAKNAAQILAHEMCHAAKTGFENSAYDEWFPRKAESSELRRLLGNFFRRWQIPTAGLASIFAGAALSAAGKTLPWGMCALAPAAAIIAREIYLCRTLSAAKKRLDNLGFDSLPLLFRLNDAEIRILAKSSNPAKWIENAANGSIRWKMYTEKFGSGEA